MTDQKVIDKKGDTPNKHTYDGKAGLERLADRRLLFNRLLKHGYDEEQPGKDRNEESHFRSNPDQQPTTDKRT
ncbi:MAG: hypothetical protein STSR0009_13000 [Methanoregula sp.]